MVPNEGNSGTLSTNLLFHLTFDGSNYSDISGNNTPFTITGTPSYIPDKDSVGKAISNAYIQTTNLYPDFATKKAISFCFFKSTDTTTRGLMSIADSPIDNYPSLLLRVASSGLQVYIRGSYCAAIPLKTGYNSVSFNFSSNDSGVLYVNGVKQSIDMTYSSNNRTYVFFGTGYPTAYTYGIDEVRMYNRYLTDDEHIELHKLGVNYAIKPNIIPSVVFSKIDANNYKRTIKYGTYPKRVKVSTFIATYFKDGGYSSGKPVGWAYDVSVPTLKGLSEYSSSVRTLEIGSTYEDVYNTIPASDVEEKLNYIETLYLVEDLSNASSVSKIIIKNDFSFSYKSQGTKLSESGFKTPSSYPNFSTLSWNLIDGIYPSLILEQRAQSSLPFQNSTVQYLSHTQFMDKSSYPNFSEPTWVLNGITYPYLSNSQVNASSLPFANNIVTPIPDATFKDINNYNSSFLDTWENGLVYPNIKNEYFISYPFNNDISGLDGLSISNANAMKMSTYNFGDSRWVINEGLSYPYLAQEYVVVNKELVTSSLDGDTINEVDSKKALSYPFDWVNTYWVINEGVSFPYLTNSYKVMESFPPFVNGLDSNDGLTITVEESKHASTYNIFQPFTIWNIDENVTAPSIKTGYTESIVFPNMSSELDGSILTTSDAIKKSSYPELNFTDYFIILSNEYPKLRLINLPSMGIPSGEYKNGIKSVFLCDENGTIKYTIDGTNPVTSETANTVNNNDSMYISKSTNIQLVQVYSFGVSDIVTYSYNIVSDVPLAKPYFPFKYATMDAITQYDNSNDIKFNFYEPIFTVIDSTVDISLGTPSTRLLSILTNHFFDIDKDLLMVNDTPLDFYEDSLTIVQENDFVYVAGDFISKLSSIDSIKILQADRYFTKTKGVFSNVMDTKDNTFIRIKKDGTVVYNNGTIITEEVLLLDVLSDLIVLSPRTLLTDPNILVANYGFGLKNGKMTNISIEKINQNTVYNTSTDIVALIPYLRDDNNKSYYENFTTTYASQIYSHIPNYNLIKRDEYDKFIYNLKENKGVENQDNYTEELNKIYQHDIGLYEKMLIEDRKNHFIFKRDSLEVVKDGIKLPWSNSEVLMNSVSVLLHVMIDNEEKLPLEVYCNRLRLPVEPESIDIFGITHLYIDVRSCFDDIFRFIYNSIDTILSYESFVLKHRNNIKLLFNEYEDLILDNITISVLKKREDFKVFNTGFVEWNKGYVEIYNSFEEAYGTSVFLDGLLLNSTDYYIEVVGGVVCLFFKRKIDKEKVNVSITYYENPICISDNVISYTDNTFINTLTYLDEVYVNGQLVTREDIYTLDTTKNILKVRVDDASEFDDTSIRIRTYYDKSLYDAHTDKDYRTKLINNLDMLSYIESLHSVKKSLNNVSRNYNDKSLEEYIFYIKYMLNSDYEKRDVYIPTSDTSYIPGYSPFTEEELTILKKKYKNLFDENGCIVYVSQSDDSDYPRDIILGDTYGEVDLDTYKSTVELSKLNSISQYPEDCVINNNYHGETIK